MNHPWTPGPLLVAGPCVLEDDALNLRVAEALAELSVRLGIRVIFKGSYLKANRSRAKAPRGPGLVEGLERLARVREATGLPVVTDVHETGEVPSVAEVADCLQIPAFLCRQTPLLEAAGRSGRPVNVKKGQWMDVAGMTGAAEKLRRAGCEAVALTERGTFFGYGDLVVDMRTLRRMRFATGAAVLFDATHAAQRPGAGPHGTSGGDRQVVPDLLCAAAAAGAGGFYLETHPDPDHAPSDSATMWPLDRLEWLVARALAAWHGVREGTVEA